MRGEGRRLTGVVLDPEGVKIGEARCWAAPEGEGWRGWLRLGDLGCDDLSPGLYRLETPDGLALGFRPLQPRTQRVIDTDLLPIAGESALPWDNDDPPEPDRYRPAWLDAPPRSPLERLPIPGLPDDLPVRRDLGLNEASWSSVVEIMASDVVGDEPARSAAPAAADAARASGEQPRPAQEPRPSGEPRPPGE